MNTRNPSPPGAANAEVSTLIERLHETDRRLEKLTDGEVDTVATRDGRTFMLRRAQDQVRHRDAIKQAAILDALPAHIALLDAQGVIISVNETWRRFPCVDAVQGPAGGIGLNYLEILESARGEGAHEVHHAAQRIRSVLSGTAQSFSIEYPCHSATQQHWFLMSVRPLPDLDPNGVVVMHVDITEKKQAEVKISRLNRVYAVLSGINTLIVRVHDRDELFREACRIAVEHGKFGLAWLSEFDPVTLDVTPVAWAGNASEQIASAKSTARADVSRGQGVVGRAIRTKKPAVCNDLEAEADVGSAKRKEAIRRGYRSLIALPLLAEEIVWGTLTLYATELNFFNEDEIRLLNELAGNISFALEHMNRQQKIDKLSRIRAVSGAINAAIIRIHDREALLRETCRIAADEGKFELVWIARIDREKQHVHPVAWAGFSAEIARDYPWARLETPGVTLAEVMRTRKVAVRNDFDNEVTVGGLREEAMRQGYRSSVSVPFTVNDSVVAVMILSAPEQKFFDDEEVALLNEVAGNVSFSLENIGKEEKIARLNRIQAVTGSINALIVRVRDRQELFDEACRIAVEQGGFGIAWIGTLDPQTLGVTPVAHAGFQADETLANFKSSASLAHPLGRGVVGRAIRERRPVFVDNLPNEPGAGQRRVEAIRRGYQSRIALPLVMDDRVIGVMVLFARERDFFSAEELNLLTQLAGDISFGVENLARQHKLDKLSRVRAVSSEINAAIVRIPERGALLKETCRIMSERGKFEMIWIGTIDHDKQQVEAMAWTGFSEEAVHAVTWAAIGAAQGTLSEAIQTRKSTVRNMTAELPTGRLQQEALEQGCHSSVCLPLTVDDRVTALVVLFSSGRAFFDMDELVLLDGVASDLSFALHAIEKSERLNYLGYYDLITGLANGTLFLERVTQHIRGAVSGGHKLALYLIDLERFKNINDSMGRLAGDALLKQVAEWLTHSVGDVNLLARVNADHFAVVMPKVMQEDGVARLLEKQMTAFLEYPFRLNDAVFRIAAKVGVAIFPDDGADADTLFRNTEAALKKAKASGDRYLFYTQKMTEMVAGKVTLENQLRQALDNEEFVLHYQPKVDLVSGEITSTEALIRWNDPRTGLVPPGEFIPILEETGLIYEVGRWSLRKAVEDYRRWRSAGLAAVRIAVNVSPRQLRNQGFVAEIEAAIGADAHAAPGLELEITESLIMEDVKHTITSLQAIGALGVTLAIDDFGTGFSSLSYLSKLPVHTLKIDRSFVVDMTEGPEGLALVSTIINLAHSLKLKVVAEGVETEEQSRLLRLLGCDEIQGFLFSKPLPCEIFETRYLAPQNSLLCPPDDESRRHVVRSS